jgi:hypothetical protein
MAATEETEETITTVVEEEEAEEAVDIAISTEAEVVIIAIETIGECTRILTSRSFSFYSDEGGDHKCFDNRMILVFLDFSVVSRLLLSFISFIAAFK